MSLRARTSKPNQTRKKTLVPFEVVIVCLEPISVIKEHALVFCKHYHLPPKQIHLFVQTVEEANAARQQIPATAIGRIVVGVPGVSSLYNFIFGFFPEGKPLVFIHEGITGVHEYMPDSRTTQPLSSMIGLIRAGFSEAQRADSGLWGMYPAVSAVHMSESVDTGLKRISNQVWGCMNPGSVIHRKQGGWEDYELPILFYELYGTIVRLRKFAANPIRELSDSHHSPPSPRAFSKLYSNFSRIDSKGNLRLLSIPETSEKEKETFPV
jgi:hypothetical protein